MSSDFNLKIFVVFSAKITHFSKPLKQNPMIVALSKQEGTMGGPFLNPVLKFESAACCKKSI